MAALADRFKWAPDFWRRMGWRELRAWLRELTKIHEREAKAHRTDPDSWDGYENDGWWAEQARRRDEIRGRR